MSEPTFQTQTQTGPWFIVNMSGRWNHAALTRTAKPSVLFWTFEEAFAEVRRMAELHPLNEYALFECKGFGIVKDKPPTDHSKKPEKIYPVGTFKRKPKYCPHCKELLTPPQSPCSTPDVRDVTATD